MGYSVRAKSAEKSVTSSSMFDVERGIGVPILKLLCVHHRKKQMSKYIRVA